MKLTVFSVLTCLLLFLTACNSEPEKKLQANKVQDRFLKPPIPRLDVPFESFQFNAEEGDTLVYASGSVIIIPPRALQNTAGETVSGPVEITYREFADPVDFFLSGVPMSYDSAGTTYTFESSGMCEINANQNGEPLFVNDKAKPEIHLMSFTESPDHNLYYLDTVSGSWINRGKDEISVVSNSSDAIESVEERTFPAFDELPAPPVEPVKATGDKPLFDIAIEPNSLEELQVYNNMRFEFVDVESVNPADSQIEYSNVSVSETDERGIVLVTFSDEKSGTENSYRARPVYEGKDYDEAFESFWVKQQKYERLAKKRQSAEQEAEKEFQKRKEQFEAERLRVERMNAITRARNAETEVWNAKVRADNERLARERAERQAAWRQHQAARQQAALQQRQLNDELRKRQEKNRRSLDMQSEIVRTFQIEQFGIWNCDEPIFINAKKMIVNFQDENGKVLSIGNYVAVYKDLNGIRTYIPNTPMDVPSNLETMLWTIHNERFAYVPYDDFARAWGSIKSGNHTFTLTVAPDSIRGREDIKMLAGI